jgi:transposase InsO family protein
MQKFFIPHIRWIVNKVVKENCYLCKLKSCKPVIPRMGDLPSMRLDAFTHLFKNTIVDVCGPFKVVIGRKSAKRWLFVASCLTTRAVHIEILHTMTGNSAILALNNLIHLRGKPEIIYSDMGTNFVGGYKEIIESYNDHNKKLIEQGIEPLKIIWENSPAKASHMNGCIERLIGLTKNALHKMEDMMNKKLYHLDDESFRAYICEVIGILNNRPLCMIPIKGTSHEFLTPNHFLMNRPNFLSRPKNQNPRFITKLWRDVQNISNLLWEHWLKAYMPTIMYRQKWIDKKSPLQIGDIVSTADPSIYNSWRLGKVIEVEFGSQQQVRKVKVLLGKNNSIKDQKILRSSKLLMKAYNAEKFTVVSRPATAVAAINLKAKI